MTQEDQGRANLTGGARAPRQSLGSGMPLMGSFAGLAGPNLHRGEGKSRGSGAGPALHPLGSARAAVGLSHASRENSWGGCDAK